MRLRQSSESRWVYRLHQLQRPGAYDHQIRVVCAPFLWQFVFRVRKTGSRLAKLRFVAIALKYSLHWQHCCPLISAPVAAVRRRRLGGPFSELQSDLARDRYRHQERPILENLAELPRLRRQVLGVAAGAFSYLRQDRVVRACVRPALHSTTRPPLPTGWPPNRRAPANRQSVPKGLKCLLTKSEAFARSGSIKKEFAGAVEEGC